MLSNLIEDENSLEFFDSLDAEILGDYDLLKEHFIDHYDTATPMPFRWNNLTSTKTTRWRNSDPISR